MSKWLSPKDIQSHYSFSRSVAYEVLKKFEESGGEVIKIGSMRRVNEEALTEWLLNRGKHGQS
jgi:transposase